MSNMPISYLRGDFTERSPVRKVKRFYSSLSTVEQPKPQYRSFNSILANLMMQDHIKHLKAEHQKQRIAGLPLYMEAPRPTITPMMTEQKTNHQLHISVPQIDSPHLHANHVAIRKIANIDKVEKNPLDTFIIPVEDGQIDESVLSATLSNALAGLGSSKNQGVPGKTTAIMEAHALKKTPLKESQKAFKAENQQSSHLI